MKEERIVLKDIPVELDEESLARYMGRGKGNEFFADLIPAVQQAAKPKAILKWVSCRVLDEKTVQVADQTFSSVLLAEKLKGLHRVFCVVITAGNELKETDLIEEDIMKDIFSGVVLASATKYVIRYLQENFDVEDAGYLQPGSLPDWPIAENRGVIEIIGDVEQDIGVTLNKAGYMSPWNSTSGILFPGSGGYMNCHLCLNLDCVGRRAPFDEAEYKRIFG